MGDAERFKVPEGDGPSTPLEESRHEELMRNALFRSTCSRATEPP
jgi:hypothetical protein